MSIGVVSWIGYVSARDSLRAAAERELMGLQRSKSALVETILKSARNEVLSLSASQAVTDAARDLLAAYRQLAREPVTRRDAGGGETFLPGGVRAGADETLGD